VLKLQILYYQYVIKKGLDAPWTTKAKQAYDASGGEQHREYQEYFSNSEYRLTLPATGSSPGDQPSWGNLLWSYPEKGDFNNDNGRTIWGGGVIGPNGTGNLNSA